MALPIIGGLLLAGRIGLQYARASRAVSAGAAAATKVKLASEYVGRNPKVISGPNWPREFGPNDITKYTRNFMERKAWQNTSNNAQLQQQLKNIGEKLFKDQQKAQQQLKRDLAKSIPRAAMEAAALGAAGTGAGALIIGGDNTPAGPRGRRPRKKPRNKDPYKPDEPEDENEEELDDSTDDTSCLDDSGDMPVSGPEEKSEITMFTPYGTLSTVR